jgi:oligoendopeptidase F
LKEQILASGLEPEGFAIPLRKLRAEAEIFTEANLALLNEEKRLYETYTQIGGAQTVEWEGKEIPVSSLGPVYREKDRGRREKAWRLGQGRRLADRSAINDIWSQLMQKRQQTAQNAGYASFRDYRWQQMFRFDYTPEDCKTFHQAVEQVVVPAARRINEKRRQRLGVETLRYWDLLIDPLGDGKPRLVHDVPALLKQSAGVMGHADPQLRSYFEEMIEKELLDLEERPNKAYGGYNLALEVKRLPFIFGKVLTFDSGTNLIFHEAGHAFHVFEMRGLPYVHQHKESFLSMEFAEVASTSMEFIGAHHLVDGGLCDPAEAARLRILHLEGFITSLFTGVAHGDAFQHWAYENPELAQNPELVDQKWAELEEKFQPGIDWSGLEAVHCTGWQRILHFFEIPFYYIEYAFAAIGALQIWQNYLRDPKQAIQQYRYALSLGASKPLPELFAAAGAKFAFDADTLKGLVDLMENTITELEASL